jgi:hypothetical protein
MAPDPQAVEHPSLRTQPALDLFAFPSDTRGWFRMLVVAACLVGLNVGFLTAQRIHRSLGDHTRQTLEALIAEMMKGRDLRELSPQEISALGHKLAPVTRELLVTRMPQAGTSLLFALLLLGGAAAIYLDHPRRYRRLHRSRPLAEDDAPTVVRDVNRWAARLGLASLRLEHRQGLGNDAQTFGLRGREILMFHGDPSLIERVWSETPKVVALHELGHVKNGDAHEREKSKAVWIALFGLLVLAACVLAGASLLDLAATWRTAGARGALASLGALRRPLLQAGWRLAVLLLLAAAIWTGLVHSFELYADRRVASWGMKAALQRLLRLPKSQPLWHPSNRLRQQILADPVRLFRVSPTLAFVTGALLSILTVNVIFPILEVSFDVLLAASTGLWSELAPRFISLPAPWGKQILLACVAILNLGQLLLMFLVPLAVLSYLVAGTLGSQVQREAVADLATGNPRTWGYARLLRPAALLALGVEAGFRIAPFNSGLDFSLSPSVLILWLAGLTCLTWLWLAYVRALTRFTLGLRVGTTLSRRTRLASTGSSIALLTALYWPAGFARMAPRISLWAQVAHWSPGADPQEIFVYAVVLTGIVLTALAFVIYLGGAAVSLAAVLTRRLRERPRCPACGEQVGLGFAIGRCCPHCEELLAPWAYEAAAVDLNRYPEGMPSS